MAINLPAGWREFTKEDWYGLAGATPFKWGEPLLRDVEKDGVDGEAIVDAEGAGLVFYDGEVEEYWSADSPAAVVWLLTRPSEPKTVASATVGTVTIDVAKLTDADLHNAGFRRTDAEES